MIMKLSAKVMHKDNCINKSFTDVYDDHLLDNIPYGLRESSVHYSTEVENNTVRLIYETTFKNIMSMTSIRHVFFFPRNHETREKAHIISRENKTGKSIIDISLADKKVNYVNATVYTRDNRLLRSDVLVFDKDGNIYPYKEFPEMYSKLKIGNVSISEVLNKKSSEKSILISVEFLDDNVSEEINIALQTSGIEIKYSEEIKTPIKYTKEILLTDPRIVNGHWLIAIGDSQNKMIAQALVYIGG